MLGAVPAPVWVLVRVVRWWAHRVAQPLALAMAWERALALAPAARERVLALVRVEVPVLVQPHVGRRDAGRGWRALAMARERVLALTPVARRRVLVQAREEVPVLVQPHAGRRDARRGWRLSPRERNLQEAARPNERPSTAEPAGAKSTRGRPPHVRPSAGPSPVLSLGAATSDSSTRVPLPCGSNCGRVVAFDVTSERGS